MTDIINPEFRDEKEDFNREIYRLLLFYKHLFQLLEIFFSGYLGIIDNEINENYLRLCVKIKEILEKPGFENLAKLNWRPFENLIGDLDPDAPDVEWEYGGRQLCANFLSTIEEVFISTGEKVYPLDTNDQQLLNQIQTYLERYHSYKKDYEAKWLQRVEEQVKKWQEQERKTEVSLPQFDFRFIKDEEIKDLIVRDWQEVKKAFENGLYKSVVVLCGAIIESLLINALSLIENEAKLSYYQKYLKSKNQADKPPEIENWKIYQLIEIANQQGIISIDAVQFSHVVRNYRNLVHLYAQKSKALRINERIASAVISFLDIVYDDILEWYEKRNK